MSERDSNDALMNVQHLERFTPKENRTPEAERTYRKERMAAALRIFGKLGFAEGVSGHFTVRDPVHQDHFWVNPMGKSFRQMRVSDLIRVNHQGQVIEGHGILNGAAFTIHSKIHLARPDIVSAAHSHSLYGKTWSTLGRLLDPISQDACAFYQDHILLDKFTGVVLGSSQGEHIARALGENKAAILRNHGLLTVGFSVEETAWWYITMERCCQSQLLAEAVGEPLPIDPECAAETYLEVGTPEVGKFSFRPLYEDLLAAEPEFRK